VKAWEGIEKKLPKNYQVKKKKKVFHENIRKYIQILLKFHFETIEPSIQFIVNQLQNFKTLE
jgi:phenylalanyl-tRNA synthetase alpha subunit